MILRICDARVCGPHSLQLTFNDGSIKQVNVRPRCSMDRSSSPCESPPTSRPPLWTRFAARLFGQMERTSRGGPPRAGSGNHVRLRRLIWGFTWPRVR